MEKRSEFDEIKALFSVIKMVYFFLYSEREGGIDNILEYSEVFLFLDHLKETTEPLI
jgi:hypothetical protein